jgi:hypothetical protein
MNSVGIKLEAALKAYLAANFQGSGMELQNVTLLVGRSPEAKGGTTGSRIEIAAGQQGGPHAQQGNYEIPVTFSVITDFEKQQSETEASLRLRHGERVSAILGIFGEARTRIVPPALTVLDAELGCSAYWHESTVETIEGQSARTDISLIFEAFLV